MFEDENGKSISESNIDVDSSKFLKVFTELLENEILTSFTEVETDLDSCVSSIVSNNYALSKDFDPKDSAVFSKTKIDYRKSIKKKYCSFITTVSYAVLGVSPCKEVVDHANSRILKYCKTRTARQICNLLLSKLMELKDAHRGETFAKCVMSSVNELEELVELSSINSFENSKEKFKKECKLVLKTINTVISELSRQNKFLSDTRVANHFVKFFLKLYKTFQCKSNLEADADFFEFEQIVQTLDASVFVFRSQKLLIIKSFILYWPRYSYNYKTAAIDSFVRICKRLDCQESNALEKVIFKKFSDLFLKSNNAIFHIAFQKCLSLATKKINYFWHSKCSQEQRKIFEERLVNLKDRQNNYSKSKMRQVNKIKK